MNTWEWYGQKEEGESSSHGPISRRNVGGVNAQWPCKCRDQEMGRRTEPSSDPFLCPDDEAQAVNREKGLQQRAFPASSLLTAPDSPP